MISPIQLTDFALHELHFSENADYEPVYGQPSTLRLYAADVLLEERTGDAGGEDDLAVPLDIRVNTGLEPLDAPAGVPDGYRFFGAYLAVEINHDDDVATRTPFRAAVVCSGPISAAPLPDDPAEHAAALQVVRANSAALLYGMARQTLLTVTRGSTSLNLVLPSLSFREIVEAEAAQEAEHPAP